MNSFFYFILARITHAHKNNKKEYDCKKGIHNCSREKHYITLPFVKPKTSFLSPHINKNKHPY